MPAAHQPPRRFHGVVDPISQPPTASARSAGLIEELLAHDLAILHRVQSYLFRRQAWVPRLGRDVVVVVDGEVFPLANEGAIHFGGMQLVVCDPPFGFLANGIEPLYWPDIS